MDWYNPFSWFGESTPSIYGGYAPPSNRSMWSDPAAWLAGAGTLTGIYSGWNNNKSKSDYYDWQKQRASVYDNQLQNYYTQNQAWQNARLAAMQSIMGQAMGSMNAPILSSYQPMSDAAAKAIRRGVTSQAALRTGGNEGGYVDAQVGEGMAKSENDRFDAAARLDAVLNQSRMSMWPALLSAMASAYGNGPVAPMSPLNVGAPGDSGMGSTDAFGQYMKWKAQQDALAAERQSNNDWRRTVGNGGQSNTPSYTSPYDVMYDYEGPS